MFYGTLEQGKVYIIRLRGRLIQARFLTHTEGARYSSNRGYTHFRFTNLETGREIILKSKAKIVRVFTESLDGVKSNLALEIASGLNNQTHKG